MRSFLLAAVALLPVSGAALAQGGGRAAPSGIPTTEDVIRSLKPDGTTRGIRPVAPAPTQAAIARPSGARPSPAETQQGVASTDMQVRFQTGSDRLTPEAVRALDTLGRALASSELREYKFRIEGHTDAAGSRAGNDALSARRAATVVDYIATHYGVDRARLVPIGLGQSQLLVPTGEGVAEPRNRRVQIVNLGS